jgi:hypothetical protein
VKKKIAAAIAAITLAALTGGALNIVGDGPHTAPPATTVTASR